MENKIQISPAFGALDKYHEGTEKFTNYISRVEVYFLANNIKENRKASIFLASCGAKVFSTAANLLDPTPIEQASFPAICEALKKHFKPKSLIIFERYKFNSRFQKTGETIAEFVTGLKELSRQCEYPAALQSELLRDRFVIGLNNSLTQQHLLAEDGLTLEKAIAIATAREASLRDSKSTRSAEAGETVHSVGFAPRGRRGATKPVAGADRAGSRKSKPNKPCFACGGSHWRSDCPFKDSTCFSCNLKGHIASHCKTKPHKRGGPSKQGGSPGKNHANAIFETYEPDFVGCLNSTGDSEKREPFRYTFFIEGGGKITGTLDTGTHHSILPKSNFLDLWPNYRERPKMTGFPGKLTAFGGHEIDILGEISVSIKTSPKAEAVQANFIVVNQIGPVLLGRQLMEKLGISVKGPDICSIPNMDNFVAKFPELFSPGLGLYKDKTFTIAVHDNMEPKFFRARPLPYALKEKVDKELDRLIQEKIIEPVNHAPMAAPIVPVLKSDGNLRLCCDYKVTVNRMVKIDMYPIPNIRDLMSGLANMTVFTKLDLSQAYSQLALSPESKVLTTISSHRGLFQFNRLPFGISSAPGIFQRAMENLFRDMDNVICYLDDLLLVSKNSKDHEKLLGKVFDRLQKTGLKLKREKCEIAVDKVVYLGFQITPEGILPTANKVDAIRKAPRPTDQTQLKSYLGLLNFFRRFLCNAASVLEPLTRLLRADKIWEWGTEQEKAFETSKSMLINSEALVHFDPEKPITVLTDSSAYGLGSVICHTIDGMERPIFFASRTLTDAERRYSQTEKEALALVYAMKQFHEYLWGQKFTLITDHKPLLGIFNPTKPISPQASGRIQRWALILQAYNFDLIHRSGKLLYTADALSRLPASETCENVPVPADWTNLVLFLDGTPVTSSMISKETMKDRIMSQVLEFLQKGWPQERLSDPEFTHYARRKSELSAQDNCLLWGTRVVIPPSLQAEIIRELHVVHSGSSKMKALARSYVWWPNLDKKLEEVSESCEICLENRPTPAKAKLHPWEWPDTPWHRLHVDFAGPVDGNYFFILVDAHSKWLEIFKTKGTATSDVIRCLQHVYATFGLPVSLVSDNGPCFTSNEFKHFMERGGVKHVTTAVFHPSSNGQAERCVQTFKNMLKKSTEPLGVAIDRFLFNYRQTPHATTGVSPAELMFGRRVRCKFDLLFPGGKGHQAVLDRDEVRTRVQEKQGIQVKNYCKRPREAKLAVHSKVMVRNYGRHGSKWLPATIDKKTGPISYRCLLEDGNQVKRHQDQVHKRTETSSPAPPLNRIPNFQGGGENPDVESSTQEDIGELPRRSGRIRKPVERYGDPVPH